MAERSIRATHTHINQSMVDVARIAKITRQLYERQQFAYLLVDHQWRLIEASANLKAYGFDGVKVGADARQSIDFLVGLESHSTLDLPIVMSPSQHPLHIVLLPEDETLTIVLMDASQDYEQRQMVQQKANENALLLAEQRRLTKDLEETQAALVKKNRQLQEASRLQTSFLSGVSHEFRTPLASMLGYVELLADRFDSQAKQTSADQLGVVKRSARHLLSLVENLLDHGKLDANEMVLNPSVINVGTLCQEVHSMMAPSAKTKNLQLSLQLSPENIPLCTTDPSRLRQILLNIVGNAIKFTDAGSVTIEVLWESDQMHLTVRDTGIGIDAADLQNISKPFWQVPLHGRAGTGLGLTITERIVEMMGGYIDVQSQLGVGTEVKITLPAFEVTPEDSQQPFSSSHELEGRHFLLAEDDQDIADLLCLLLDENGIQVTRVENGDRAISMAAKHQFDVILMDLQMPVVDGYEATKEIRAQGVATPILVMTASAIEADRSHAERVGCDGYLVKPVAIDEVLALADELLKTQAANDEA